MKQKRAESLKLNLLFNILYQMVTVLSPIIVTPKISRVFGVDYIGVKSYTFSIVYYFAIFGVLGLDMLGQRKIAIVKEDELERSKVFWTIYCTRFFLVFLSLIVYCIYASTSPLSKIERAVTFCWVFYLIREMINPIWFLQGLEKFRLLSILGIISQIGYILGTILLVGKKTDLPLYILVYTVIPLIISFCYFPTVRRNVIFIKPRLNDMIHSTRESIVYFVPTIATAIYSMVDKTMLGFFDPQKISTGLYESAERLVKVALALSTASFTIMRTRMSYLFGKRNSDEYRKTCSKFMSFSMMLCWPIMFGIIGISRDFVPVFFGAGFEDVVGLSYVFSLVVPCLTISGLLQAVYIFPYGLQKTMDIYYGIIVSINIVMNLILINFWGALGAIIASVFAEFLLALILINRAKTDIDVGYLAIGSIKYFLAGVIMLIVMWIISSSLSIDPIMKIAIEFTCAVFTYFIVCFILQDGFVLSQAKTISQRLKRVVGLNNSQE